MEEIKTIKEKTIELIDALKAIGCDTAKSVLAIPRQDLIRRTDLEEETIDELLAILKAEFEEENEEVFDKTEDKTEEAEDEK